MSKIILGKDRANSLAHASKSTSANPNPPPMHFSWVFDWSSLPQRDEPSCFQHSCQLKGVVMSKLILGNNGADANPNPPPMLCAWVFDCSSVPQRDEPSCFQHSCQLKGVVMSKLILGAKIAQIHHHMPQNQPVPILILRQCYVLGSSIAQVFLRGMNLVAFSTAVS